MKKKGLFSAGIAAVICILALMFTTIMASANPFKDVPEKAWYYPSVMYANDNGLMRGVSETEFGPNETMSRAMIVTVLHRMEKEPAAPASGFKDVPAGKWYTVPVAWAAQKGIVNGTTPETFEPNGNVTREQIAAFLYRYAGAAGYDVSQQADLTGFSDYNAISKYAGNALSWANANGLVKGTDNNRLAPKDNAKRCEVAAIFQRFCENIMKPSGDDPDSRDPLPLPDDPSEADTYYWEHSEKVLRVEDALESEDVLTEKEAVALLKDRGFDDYEITFDFSIDGEYSDNTEAENDNAVKHPQYRTMYVTEKGDAWSIFVIEDQVIANPIFYNVESGLESELLISEAGSITAYDWESNQFYEIIPNSAGAIVKTVKKIDADTLEKLTVEEIERL